MEKIEIGKRWPGAMPGYDSPVFDYTPSGPILTLYMAQPTSKEIADAKAGKLRIGYYVKGCVLARVAGYFACYLRSFRVVPSWTIIPPHDVSGGDMI